MKQEEAIALRQRKQLKEKPVVTVATMRCPDITSFFLPQGIFATAL